MAIGRGRLIDGAGEIQHLTKAIGGQVKMLADQFGEGLTGQLARAESLHHDGGGLGHADRIGHLYLTALRQTGSHDVLGDVAGGIGRRTVDLRRVLTRKRATTVASVTAIRVDDDLAPGQAAITDRATDHEFTSRIDMKLGALINPARRQDGKNDLLHHGLTQLPLTNFRGVLSGENHCFNADRSIVLVAERDLTLRIRPQPGKLLGLADQRLALHQPVRIGNGCRHQNVSFVRRVAEHEALVAGALLAGVLAVYALGDVRRLLAENVDDRATGAVKPHFAAVIANFQQSPTDDGLEVHRGGRGDFAGQNSAAGFHQRLARDTGLFVLGEDGVQYRIRYLIGDLVRVAFRNRFRREKVAVRGHGIPMRRSVSVTFRRRSIQV